MKIDSLALEPLINTTITATPPTWEVLVRLQKADPNSRLQTESDALFTYRSLPGGLDMQAP